MRLDAVRASDGRIDLQSLLPQAASPPADASAGAPSNPPFLLVLRKAAIDDYAIRVEDRTRSEPFNWSLAPLSATIENFSTAPGKTANMSVRATVNRKGTLVATGPIGIQPLTARLRVEARALDIAPVQRFIDDKVNVTVTSGLLSMRGRLSVDLAPGKPLRAAYAGELNLADFVAVDKTSQQDLLKWKSLFVGGVDFDLEPLKVSVGEVALADFYSRFIVNADGTLNLQNILVKEGEAGTSTTTPATTAASPKPADVDPVPATTIASEPTPSPPQPPNIRIGKITLQGGNVNFSDFFIRPNYSANLTGIGGSVTEMTPEIAADLELRGKVDNTAPVEIAGRLNPLAKDLLLDIKASARDIELPPLTAYSVKYAGYGIEKGKLSVTVKYFIENRKLSAENNVRLDQLTFGEKVESPDRHPAPRAAGRLLAEGPPRRHRHRPADLRLAGRSAVQRRRLDRARDRQPADEDHHGTLLGAGVRLRQPGGAVVRRIPAGGATLDDDARKRLDALAKALTDRPALKIEVSGRVDPASDRNGLKQAHVQSRVKAEKMRRLTRDGRATASIDDVTG